MLFYAYHIVIDRLAAVHDADLRLGEAARDGAGRVLGVLLAHILAVVDRDELGGELVKGPAQLLEERLDVGIAAQQRPVEQSQILARVDAVTAA